MQTAVISDLHLGAGSGVDLLRHERIREHLAPALDGVDRLVLLGDIVELRDRPLAESLDRAAPTLAAIGDAAGDAEIVVVAGNHDHRLIEPWLDARAIEGAGALELEHRGDLPRDGAPGLVADALGAGSVSFAYPGIRITDDVYAMHGHYLDRHLTIPTLERLGIAMVERILGIAPVGPDPLDPPPERVVSPDDYERVVAPVYSFLFGLAQATVGERPGGADPSVRVWKMLSGGETRAAKVRSWLLGSVALPGAVGIANRLGLGPVGADLSPRAIARAGLDAIGDVVERLGIQSEHVIFGHTHRRGPLGDEPGWTAGETKLWNTGSWVHTASLLGETAAVSPYWPGTIAFVEDGGPPRLEHLLDGLSRSDLANPS